MFQGFQNYDILDICLTVFMLLLFELLKFLFTRIKYTKFSSSYKRTHPREIFHGKQNLKFRPPGR